MTDGKLALLLAAAALKRVLAIGANFLATIVAAVDLGALGARYRFTLTTTKGAILAGTLSAVFA